MCAQAAGINLFLSVCSCLCVSLYACECAHLCVCVCTCMHNFVCFYIKYIYTLVSMCIIIWVFLSVYIWASFKLRECLILVCGCVFIQTDAVWWSECQHCSRLPITVCYLSCFSVCLLLTAELLICSTTLVCLCFCVETVWTYTQRTINTNKLISFSFLKN